MTLLRQNFFTKERKKGWIIPVFPNNRWSRLSNQTTTRQTFTIFAHLSADKEKYCLDWSSWHQPNVPYAKKNTFVWPRAVVVWWSASLAHQGEVMGSCLATSKRFVCDSVVNYTCSELLHSGKRIRVEWKLNLCRAVWNNNRLKNTLSGLVAVRALGSSFASQLVVASDRF